MKKMMYFAAFAIMMAMGNMNAYAVQNGAKHAAYYMNDRGVVVAYHGDRADIHAAHRMSHHERRMMEEARRREEIRKMEEARRMEEMRRMEAHRRNMEHRYEANRVAGKVAAGVAAGVTLAALIGALAR